ncbi:hypothetical protein ABR737_19015 [Streptomyces sp. Edi2]|uniref:hypothetical protein n=1 Tax=Streptomyces sp. Edi2 TaxID=3162528 RepID=UPI003305D0F6
MSPAEESIDDSAVAEPPPARRSGQLRIGWIMPEFIRELPVDATDMEAVAESLYALATDLMPEHSADDQFRFALGIGAQLEAMADANVIYAGMCFLEVEGRPTASTIVVSQIEHDSEDEASALRTTRELLEHKHPDDDFQTVELPCGPALTRVGGSGFVMAAETSPTGREELISQSEIQVFVPLPDTAEMLIFELASPSPEGWELHSELFAEILKTIDWGTDQEIEDYRTMRQGASAAVEPEDGVKQELYWHSSRLMDAVALQGSMGGGDIASLTCAECWAKGLRSACSARHSWYIGELTSGDLTGALPRVVESFASQGWRTDDEITGERVGLRAGDEAPERSVGHTLTASVDTGAGRFTAEVTSPCTRASAPADSLFG